MNRRQRREFERKSGISKHRKSLPLSEQFEIIRNNILAGKRESEEFKRASSESQTSNIAEKNSSQIYDLALTISAEEKISFIDAIEIAKTRIKSKKS